MKKSLKYTLYVFSFLILLLLIAGGTVFFRYRSCEARKQDPVIALTEPAVMPKSLTVAEKLPLVFQVETLWGRHLTSMEAEPGKGSQLVSEPVVSEVKYRWGKTFRKITVPVQAYRTGLVPEGKLTLSFESRAGKEKAEIRLPSFASVPAPDAGKELILAGEAPLPEKRLAEKRYLWCAGILVLLGIGIVFLLIRRKGNGFSAAAVPPWEKALLSIEQLRKSLRSGQETPENSVTLLTDVVRRYLESRFSLRIEHQTTPEFLREMDREEGPLASGDRLFLREFLSASDMVKFARLPAEPALFENAADKAENLIRGTVPADPEKRKENR